MLGLKSLLSRYETGCGYRKGHRLVPRDGASPCTFDVAGPEVIVLEQSVLAPHQYTVIGERVNPKSPSDQFVKFSIDGHDWQKK